jgi:dTMP kinase
LSGRFITIEGGEGGGKSTFILALKTALLQKGIEVVATREPGGTPGAEEIRALLLKGHVKRWDHLSEALLLFAGRRDLIVNLIKPALSKNTWVLCDRFVDSTIAYQGSAGGLSVTFIKNLYDVIAEGLVPDLTFILDIDPEIGLARATDRLLATQNEEGRFEQMPLSFHQKIRQCFLDLATQNPERYCVIDATQSPEAIVAQAFAHITQKGWVA